MTTLVPKKLIRSDVPLLAPYIREADLRDLTVHRSNPYDALDFACLYPGEAWGVWDGDTLIGAGGWTQAGSVWTLWRELSFGQARALMANVVPWARIIAIRSAQPLQNVYIKGNLATEKWLKATRCVDILEHNPLTWEGREYIPFYLKPLEALPYV